MRLQLILLKWILLFLFILIWYKALFYIPVRFSFYDPSMHIAFNLNSLNICLPTTNGKTHAIDLDKVHSFQQIRQENSHLLLGGEYIPIGCKTFQKLAIIIPYRNRKHHLGVLLNRLHPMLKKQNVHYRIFVINQMEGSRFNRGLVFNIGVAEALHLMDFNCIIFHDVDLVPENDENLYLCDNGLRQFSSAIDNMRYHVMYWNYAGGVVAISLDNYFKINGYPNVYWGWGNEDDDFSARTILANMRFGRPIEHIGRFKMAKHVQEFRNNEGYSLFTRFRGRVLYDGANSIVKINKQSSFKDWEKTHKLQHNSKVSIHTLVNKYPVLTTPYKVMNVHLDKLYTNITVDVLQISNYNLTRRIKKLPSQTNEGLLWLLMFYGWI